MEGPNIFTLDSNNGVKVVLGHYEARRSKNGLQLFMLKAENKVEIRKVDT